jgi:hypothetical protein
VQGCGICSNGSDTSNDRFFKHRDGLFMKYHFLPAEWQ